MKPRECSRGSWLRFALRTGCIGVLGLSIGRGSRGREESGSSLSFTPAPRSCMLVVLKGHWLMFKFLIFKFHGYDVHDEDLTGHANSRFMIDRYRTATILCVPTQDVGACVCFLFIEVHAVSA